SPLTESNCGCDNQNIDTHRYNLDCGRDKQAFICDTSLSHHEDSRILIDHSCSSRALWATGHPGWSPRLKYRHVSMSLLTGLHSGCDRNFFHMNQSVATSFGVVSHP